MKWNVFVLEPIQVIISQVAAFLPSLFGFLLILLIGWIVANIVRSFMAKLLIICKLDLLSGKIGVSGFLEKAGVRYTLSELISIILYWAVVFISFAAALHALGLTAVSAILDRMILFVPNIVSAIFVLLLGIFLATFLSGAVITLCVNAGITQAHFFGKMVSVSIIILAVIIALEQLNIATTLINAVITIFFASMGLAFAIAFGLGAKDVARDVISDFAKMFKKEQS